MQKFMARQGDVLIEAVDALPSELEAVKREGGRVILAHGELTGHAHAIKDKRATLFRDPKLNEMFMLVDGDRPVALKHDEHDTIDVPPGRYKVTRQREYSPEAIRNVAD